jgi:hypothetical protein
MSILSFLWDFIALSFTNIVKMDELLEIFIFKTVKSDIFSIIA